MKAPKVEVKTIDYRGEAHYTVFIDGEEMTGVAGLPVKNRDTAWQIAEELLNDMDVLEDCG